MQYFFHRQKQKTYETKKKKHNNFIFVQILQGYAGECSHYILIKQKVISRIYSLVFFNSKAHKLTVEMHIPFINIISNNSELYSHSHPCYLSGTQINRQTKGSKDRQTFVLFSKALIFLISRADTWQTWHFSFFNIFCSENY